MFHYDKNINVNGGGVDYISFGKGDKYLIIVPGLGDCGDRLFGTK